jgi:hypothetical protein
VVLVGRMNTISPPAATGPDLVVAGQAIAAPFIPTSDGRKHPQPFKCDDNGWWMWDHDLSFGVALIHLLWAMEYMYLGEIPWAEMMGEAFS